MHLQGDVVGNTKEEAPVCVACNAVITVKHILIECADLLEIRHKRLKNAF